MTLNDVDKHRLEVGILMVAVVGAVVFMEVLRGEEGSNGHQLGRVVLGTRETLGGAIGGQLIIVIAHDSGQDAPGPRLGRGTHGGNGLNQLSRMNRRTEQPERRMNQRAEPPEPDEPAA